MPPHTANTSTAAAPGHAPASVPVPPPPPASTSTNRVLNDLTLGLDGVAFAAVLVLVAAAVGIGYQIFRVWRKEPATCGGLCGHARLKARANVVPVPCAHVIAARGKRRGGTVGAGVAVPAGGRSGKVHGALPSTRPRARAPPAQLPPQAMPRPRPFAPLSTPPLTPPPRRVLPPLRVGAPQPVAPHAGVGGDARHALPSPAEPDRARGKGPGCEQDPAPWGQARATGPGSQRHHGGTHLVVQTRGSKLVASIPRV